MLIHQQKIDNIIKQLKAHKGSQPVSLRKKAVSHEVPKLHDKRHSDKKIDVRVLNEILEIDQEKKICTAEPGVTFVDLVRETLKYDLVPIIVPELKTITIGGAVAGCSIESMSFKHGGFHDTCLEYEVITAKGEILTCTPNNENSLIFQMVHGTFGTLGIISKLKFKLVPAKPFVRVTYEKYHTLKNYKAAIWKHFKDKDVDFMDGIIHSPELYVLSLANFVEEAPYTHNYDWMRVYYISTRERKEDYLTTSDYFFRYENGVTNVSPSSFLGRLFFGKFLDSTRVLTLATKLRKIIPTSLIPFTLDLFIPFSKATNFLEWYQKEINFFPLWCVPYRMVRYYEWIAPNALSDDELFLDLAVYGMKTDKKEHYHKIIETKLKEIGGLKTLISHNYYSEEDFWNIWNKDNYDQAKQITDPDNIFRNLYTKTCRASRGLS